MLTYSGELTFSRVLNNSEIIAVQTLINNEREEMSLPNNGIFPFIFDSDVSKLIWDNTEAYELENVIKNFIDYIKNFGLSISGDFKCIDTIVYEDSYKIMIRDNDVLSLGINDKEPSEVHLLQCPHCHKVYRKEAFKSVQN